MDRRGRRGRKRRGQSRQNYQEFFHNPDVIVPLHRIRPNSDNSSSILNFLYSIFIMGSLIAVVCALMDYHCQTCSAKRDLNSISKNINDISQNLTGLKDNYYDIESKVSKFSYEFPRIEGQIEILEKLARSLEGGCQGWDPKSSLSLPYVDVVRNHTPIKKADHPVYCGPNFEHCLIDSAPMSEQEAF